MLQVLRLTSTDFVRVCVCLFTLSRKAINMSLNHSPGVVITIVCLYIVTACSGGEFANTFTSCFIALWTPVVCGNVVVPACVMLQVACTQILCLH